MISTYFILGVHFTQGTLKGCSILTVEYKTFLKLLISGRVILTISNKL